MANGEPVNNNGSWTSPSTVSKFITQVGAPWVLLVIVLGLAFAVVTGLLKTPLMNGLEIIPDLKADEENAARILQDIRYLNQVECMRNSETAQERAECSLPVQR